MKQLPSNITEKNAVAETLTAFQVFLQNRDLSPNTISSYMFGARDFLNRYGEITPEHIRLYKAYLMEHYRPQTVNSRIRALNSFLHFQKKQEFQTRLLKIQQKKYTEYVISQGDYEYLKQRLWEDEQLTFYYIVRLIAATGVRVSELVEFNCEDVSLGYRDILSKGSKMRRVYIPAGLQHKMEDWLLNEKRKKGPLFLNHSGCRISVSGVRKQLKTLGCRYGLDPKVVYPHSLRHRFAKNFIEKGGDISFLSDLLGHESIETTRIYLRKTSTEQAQIFNQVVNW